MSLSMMAPLSRSSSPPSWPLSRERTYHLAQQARRKSLDRHINEDLRLKLSHVHVLENVLLEIARSEREQQTSPTIMPQSRDVPTTPLKLNHARSIRFAGEEVDEYGFPLDDAAEDDEEMGALSLTRTESRRPVR
jgi:hypothetical protein